MPNSKTPAVAAKTVVIAPEAVKAAKELLAAYRAANPVSSTRYGNTVTLVGPKLPQDKLAPQARIVLKALASFKNATATVQELLDAMGKIWPTDRYRQGPKRIFFFYRKDLCEGGFIKTA
jgi:hypothetical protein